MTDANVSLVVQLQEQYLPELRELYHECSRVLSKLGLDGTKKGTVTCDVVRTILFLSF